MKQISRSVLVGAALVAALGLGCSRENKTTAPASLPSGNTYGSGQSSSGSSGPTGSAATTVNAPPGNSNPATSDSSSSGSTGGGGSSGAGTTASGKDEGTRNTSSMGGTPAVPSSGSTASPQAGKR